MPCLADEGPVASTSVSMAGAASARKTYMSSGHLPRYSHPSACSLYSRPPGCCSRPVIVWIRSSCLQLAVAVKLRTGVNWAMEEGRSDCICQAERGHHGKWGCGFPRYPHSGDVVTKEVGPLHQLSNLNYRTVMVYKRAPRSWTRARLIKHPDSASQAKNQSCLAKSDSSSHPAGTRLQ